jgi:fructose-1,6-bisphosphatase/inositol monophosphatase family enzyme
VVDVRSLLEPILRLQAEIRDAVVAACERSELEALAEVVEEAADDTIYAVDRVGEERLLDFCSRELAREAPIVVVAEGLAEGKRTFPADSDEREAVWRVIVDPIDGTRGLMVQKRSAWVLTGVAPNRGPETSLRDIQLAVQTEIPLVKQHLSDVVWALRGRGFEARRFDRLSGDSVPIRPRASRARNIAHGFAQVVRFFPGGRRELAALEEEIVRGALGPVPRGKAHCFEDQYICTGGQLYELMAGHDRFVADLRPLVDRLTADRGEAPGACCHPYDICTELIAREAGVEVTDARGDPLAAPLDVNTDVDWVGYANPEIRASLQPLLQRALRSRGLLPPA